MKQVWFCILVLLMVGCSKKMLQSTSSSQQDSTGKTISTVFITTVKDSIVKTPADSSWLKALVLCDSNNMAYLAQITEIKNGKRITAPTVQISRAGALYIKCDVDSQAVYYKIRELYASTDTSNFKSHSDSTLIIKQPIVYAKKLTWWQKTQMNFGRLCFILLVLWCIYKLLKTYTKMQLPATNILKIFKKNNNG